MILTEAEQKICDQYGQVGTDGKVHCAECPLVIDKRFCLCKANCTEEEWNTLPLWVIPKVRKEECFE